MLRCKNVKLHLILDKNIDLKKLYNLYVDISIKKTCYILKPFELESVITVYKHTQKNCHVTGIKSKNDFFNIIIFFNNILNSVIISVVIDNSIFTSKSLKTINLTHIIKKIKNKLKAHSFRLIEEIFPAIFIKPNHASKLIGFPTIMIFSTGSYVIIGGKSLKHIKMADILTKKILAL